MFGRFKILVMVQIRSDFFTVDIRDLSQQILRYREPSCTGDVHLNPVAGREQDQLRIRSGCFAIPAATARQSRPLLSFAHRKPLAQLNGCRLVIYTDAVYAHSDRLNTSPSLKVFKR